jgi:hypothetical protein
MPMGNIQKQKFQTWLTANVPNYPMPCSVCGRATWDAGEIVDTSGVSGVLAPMVQLVCRTCGNVLLFDAKKTGVV